MGKCQIIAEQRRSGIEKIELGVVIKEISARWLVLPSSTKQAYDTKFKVLGAKYRSDLEAYKNSFIPDPSIPDEAKLRRQRDLLTARAEKTAVRNAARAVKQAQRKQAMKIKLKAR